MKLRSIGIFICCLLLGGGIFNSVATAQIRDARALQTDVRSLNITRVQLDSIALINELAKPWDQDGTPPDVYFRLTDAEGKDILSTRTVRFTDAEATAFPLIWEIDSDPRYALQPLDKPFLLSFYDADDDPNDSNSPLNDQLMLSLKLMPNTLLLGGGKPSKHHLQGKNYSVYLSLYWE